jgi:hypothetical protein
LKHRIIFHVVAVIVLTAVVAAAQSPEPKQKSTGTGETPSQSTRNLSASKATAVSARETGTGMATGRKSGSVIVLDRESVNAGREAGSGMATGKRVSGDPHEYLQPHTSAHEAVSLDGASKDPGKMSEAQSNPLYKDGGTKGSNPLYEGKDRTAAPPSSNGSKPADYKDGEDGIAHTRPGNHKPAE